MNKIALLALAVAIMFIPKFFAAEAKADVDPSDNLYIWYASYNDVYFGDKLPRDPVITHAKLPADTMADTTYNEDDKRFHIRLNSMYRIGPRFEHLTLQHELCHIATFDEDVYEPDGVKNHGPRWRACQLRLETSGAWREELIDGYKGN
jgi:hypothetical protein